MYSIHRLSGTMICSAFRGNGKAPVTAAKSGGSWVRTMMKNLMTSGTELVDLQLRQLFSNQEEGRYFRLNPDLLQRNFH